MSPLFINPIDGVRPSCAIAHYHGTADAVRVVFHHYFCRLCDMVFYFINHGVDPARLSELSELFPAVSKRTSGLSKDTSIRLKDCDLEYCFILPTCADRASLLL